jgi:chromosomal replication initiator protein
VPAVSPPLAPAASSSTGAASPAVLLYDDIRGRLSPQDFETWFRGTLCEFHAPDRFVISVPNRFREAWLEKKYRNLLLRSARSLLRGEARLEFRIDAVAPAIPPQGGSGSQPPVLGGKGALGKGTTLRDLNPAFTFASFVAGPCNRVAHAAALAVAEAPGDCYNPFFVYGERGVGKTHLLHAICHQLWQLSRPRIAYFSSDAFTSQFVASLGSSDLKAFRERCRDTEVLVLDDIHFLARKERTQEELFHTINALLDAHKQIIVSSVGSTRDTDGIHERILSRFRSGLATRIDPPDPETRLAVLLTKAAALQQALPLNVAEFISERVSGNLREIEGALARLLNVASLRQSSLDIESARIALREIRDDDPLAGCITISQILHTVQEYFDIKPRELLSRSKVRALVHARQVGMHLARQLTPLSLAEIGMHFGGRDHTTVLYALSRIEDHLASKPSLRADIERLTSRLSSTRFT